MEGYKYMSESNQADFNRLRTKKSTASLTKLEKAQLSDYFKMMQYFFSLNRD